MKEWLNYVLSRIEDESLLPNAYYGQLDCNAVLDSRDSDAAFVVEWCREFEEVGQQWALASITVEERDLADRIRRDAFVAVSRATQQHEIAGYVAEDIDLIVRARLVGEQSVLLTQLWMMYDRGEFPRPPFRSAQNAAEK